MRPALNLRDEWRDLACNVALASDEEEAFSTISREVARVVGESAWIVEVADEGVRILSCSAADASLEDSGDGASRLFSGALATEGRLFWIDGWTAIKLTDTGRRLLLVVSGGESTDAAKLAPLATWLPALLTAIGERSRRPQMERQLLDQYKLARRIGRSQSGDVIARHVAAQTARAVGAERVGVAIYAPGERQLALAATHGYTLPALSEHRISPGDWVMGHVFACGRALVVGDVRRLGPSANTTRGYKTFSFAAVPIVVGRKVLGVIAATDKQDGGRFSRGDVTVLRALAGVAGLGLAVSRSDAEANRLAHAATVDALTGLFNRRYFDVRLRQELERGRRAGLPPSVLIIDIDDFKAINDTHGHASGDVVLQVVARQVVAALRVFDVCARIGGDEMAVVMPSGDPASVRGCAERIRSRIANGAALDERLAGVAKVTVSIGVTTAEADDTPERVMRRADEGLYSAKNAGKNCVRVATRTRRPAESGDRA